MLQAMNDIDSKDFDSKEEFDSPSRNEISTGNGPWSPRGQPAWSGGSDLVDLGPKDRGQRCQKKIEAQRADMIPAGPSDLPDP